MAQKYVRVRLPRVDLSDLSVFEFDYDLTMMTFFLTADEKVYARHGGRGPDDAEGKLSLAGLKYTMEAVLKEHEKGEKAAFAPRSSDKALYIREATGGGGGRCLHCHQVKEQLNAKLVRDEGWTRDAAWRYPLPENLGVKLEVDRGNVVETVTAGSVAEKAGLKKGDVVRRVGAVPVHSFADAQFALDKAPVKGELEVVWTRGGTESKATLPLAYGWKKTDNSWRPSMQRLLPTLPLFGKDLTVAEKKALGLTEKQAAFRLGERVNARATDAGAKPGDVVIGVDDHKLEMTGAEVFEFVKREYLVGDTVTATVIRDGKKETFRLALANR